VSLVDVTEATDVRVIVDHKSLVNVLYMLRRLINVRHWFQDVLSVETMLLTEAIVVYVHLPLE